MTATRDGTKDLGGWASPVAALLSGGPGVPEELTAFGEQIRLANRAAVLAARACWHAVVPIDGAEHALDQPWATFTRRPRSSPADLLRADFGVVPYLFRDADLDDAVGWCEAPAAMEMTVLSGRGGAGKTRFAIELCRRMAKQGWVAGPWTNDGAPDIATVALPRLIVIDYAEAVVADALRSALERLRRFATEVAPVRVALLIRTHSGAASHLLRDLVGKAPAALRSLLDGADDRDATRTLTSEQRLSLYEVARANFVRAWYPERDPASGQQADPRLSESGYALPLDVLFEALDGALCDEQRPDDGRPPVARALDHERRYWQATAPDGLVAELRPIVVALATLAGARDDAEADALLCAHPALAGDDHADIRGRTARWLADLYPGPAALTPLRPDRLGEALVASVLAGELDGGRGLLDGVVALPSDHQVAHCLSALARCIGSEPGTAVVATAVLANRHADLVGRAERQAHGTMVRPGALTLANGLLRLLAGAIAQGLATAEPGNTTYQRDLSISYNKLADVAREAGQSDEAQRLYRQRLAIAQGLATAEPGNTTYQRDLSISYERLGVLAEDRKDARQWLWGFALPEGITTVIRRVPESVKALS